MTTLFGKTAIVTGGARDIGRAIAHRLARDGAYVIIAHCDEHEAADSLVHDIAAQGGWAAAIEADIRRSSEVARLFSEAERRLGASIDIAVAAAECFIFRPVTETDDADFDAILAINLHATFYTLREAARRVADGGRIIAVSRDLAQSPSGTAAFAASKAGVEQLVRVMAREVSWRGVTVNAVMPTPRDIEGLGSRLPAATPHPLFLERRRLPRDLVGIASFLASDDAQPINGRNIGTKTDLDSLLCEAVPSAITCQSFWPADSDRAS